MTALADENRTPPLIETTFPHSPQSVVSLIEGQPPIVIFCKSHSGGRLLVRLMEAVGVFMGAHQNGSGDSWDILPIVRYLVTRYYPDYAGVLRGEDPLLADMVEVALLRHLMGYDPANGRRWGWKLCETTFILPVVAQLFRRAQFIHLVRDGRDVAFSDHTGATDAFWRKVIFDRADIRHWEGLPMTGPGYRARPHLFNAQHWMNSVRVGHDAAAGFGERCLELRYEDLCLNLEVTAARLSDFLGLGSAPATLPAVHLGSIGKFRRQSRHNRQAVLKLIAPMQAILGYPVDAQ